MTTTSAVDVSGTLRIIQTSGARNAPAIAAASGASQFLVTSRSRVAIAHPPQAQAPQVPSACLVKISAPAYTVKSANHTVMARRPGSQDCAAGSGRAPPDALSGCAASFPCTAAPAVVSTVQRISTGSQAPLSRTWTAVDG